MTWDYDKGLQCWITGTPEAGAGVRFDSRGHKGSGWYYNVMFEGTMVMFGDGPYDLREEAIADAEDVFRKASSPTASALPGRTGSLRFTP